MMLILREPSLLRLMSPELWYAVGVMNATRNTLGLGQTTIIGVGVDSHAVNKIARSGWWLELECASLERGAVIHWIADSYTFLAAQGFAFHLVKPYKRVRVVYAPTKKFSFYITEAQANGEPAKPAKTR